MTPRKKIVHFKETELFYLSNKTNKSPLSERSDRQ